MVIGKNKSNCKEETKKNNQQLTNTIQQLTNTMCSKKQINLYGMSEKNQSTSSRRKTKRHR